MNPSGKGRALLDSLAAWFAPLEQKREQALSAKHVELQASVGGESAAALSYAALAIGAALTRVEGERGKPHPQHRAHELVDIYARIEASRALFDQVVDEAADPGAVGSSARGARVATLLSACLTLNRDLLSESVRSGELEKVGAVAQWIEAGLRGALTPAYEASLRAERSRI